MKQVMIWGVFDCVCMAAFVVVSILSVLAIGI